MYLDKKKKDALIGTWELAKKESAIKSQLSIIPIEKSKDSKNEKRKEEIVINFMQDSNADIKQGSQRFKAKYFLLNNKLTLGTTEYKILKLNSDSLIIIPENQLMPTTYHYFKSNKKLNP